MCIQFEFEKLLVKISPPKMINTDQHFHTKENGNVFMKNPNYYTSQFLK
jgi:hypothetical protein